MGHRLPSERAALDMTVTELAARARVDRKTIQRIEAGRNRPRLQTQYRILRALGLDPLERGVRSRVFGSGS